MEIKGVLTEDFINYKKPSMLIMFPNCSFKCGSQVCQNYNLAQGNNIEVSAEKLVDMYMNNSITSAIVCGGLEPFDSYKDLLDLIIKLRKVTNDDIVIYTGYTEEEIKIPLQEIKQYPNIIIKFGRYMINNKSHFDEILGVNLASDNQYGKKVS